MNQQTKPNRLIREKSPYLRQHAYNPVDWYPWGEEALNRAKLEDKPMIISIGYSACHWCHVMEHESFENDAIARVMNEGFVCIKVDREERPDVDQVYMEAIQMMGINGGWPLNVFTMPDQKPFYGGTYFRPEQWMHILKSIMAGYKDQRPQIEESAREFAKSLSISDSEKYGLENTEYMANPDDLAFMVGAMKNHLDPANGGLKRAPKFPNPSIWKFLFTSNYFLKDHEIEHHMRLTLNKMSWGGIYDHIGGGFARYSVDNRWFAPHFEKMLYDNAQLVSLYSIGYQVTGEKRYRQVVYETIEFVKRELMSPEYGFYSALDADSEGEEGKYYVWTTAEMTEVLGADAEIIVKYFNASPDGNWEHGNNILFTSGNVDSFCRKESLEESTFLTILNRSKEKLLAVRSHRIRPGLDDKILAGWNAMMIKGLTEAYHAFGNNEFLELAIKNAVFITKHLYSDGKLSRIFAPDGKSIAGFLEDYALVCDAFIALYQATFDRGWLKSATQIAEYALDNFYDPSEEFFFFTDRKSEALIAHKKELFDNVIPASNSVMAQNLFWLGHLLGKKNYLTISQQMLGKVIPLMRKEVQYLTNWGTLYALQCRPLAEIAIIGKDYSAMAGSVSNQFIPNKIIVGSESEQYLPLLEHRTAIDGKTTAYVCFNKSCKLPVFSAEDIFAQLQ